MSIACAPSERNLPPALRVGDRCLEFGQRAYIMGVLNVTPDSFSDGGQFLATDAAVEQAMALADAGADIIDIGGESTRPGADPVSASEEKARVLPVVEALRQNTDCWLSIDTYKATVAADAIDAGADIVNDVSALGDDDMASVVADAGCGLVLMHMRNTPKTMQQDIDYGDVVDDIRAFFDDRIDRAIAAGIDGDRIIVDPGIGFGKTVDHNYRLVRELNTFSSLDCPLLVGTSRKSFIGAVIDRPAQERIWGTAATVACSIFSGADIVRVHDVEQMGDVVRVTEAVCDMDGPWT